MAVDCAQELRNHNVACVSLWPGAVLTENIKEMLDKNGDRVDPGTGIKVGVWSISGAFSERHVGYSLPCIQFCEFSSSFREKLAAITNYFRHQHSLERVSLLNILAKLLFIWLKVHTTFDTF